MRYWLKNSLKYYVMGYLNEYYTYSHVCTKYCPDVDYKQFKLQRTLVYLKLPERYKKICYVLLRCLAKLELVLSFVIISFRLFKYSFLSFFLFKRRISNSKLILGNTSYSGFIKMIRSVDLNEGDITVFTVPTIKTKYFGLRTISIFSSLSFFNVLHAYVYSLKAIICVIRKYSKRDLLFRAYNSFEFFLVSIFFFKIDRSNDIYFFDLIDRWAFLHGHLPNKTFLIQHGVLTRDIRLLRIGRVDVAYYINCEQRKICEDILLFNIPGAYYRKGLYFTANDKLINNEKKNVLLVCNRLFFEKEKNIIVDLSLRQINLYIKPHPDDKNIQVYFELRELYNFHILDNLDFPKVDVVISYDSTLADEYENRGIKVIRYSDLNFDNEYMNI